MPAGDWPRTRGEETSILLEAELAAGKTTLVKGLVEGLGGEKEAVSSPTFVLIQSYDCNAGGIDTVHHVDLYRLEERSTTSAKSGSKTSSRIERGHRRRMAEKDHRHLDTRGRTHLANKNHHRR